MLCKRKLGMNRMFIKKLHYKYVSVLSESK